MSLYKTLLTAWLLTYADVCVAQHQPYLHDNSTIFISPITSRNVLSPLLVLSGGGDTLQVKHFNTLTSGFARWKYDGKVRYSYCVADTSYYKRKDILYQPGYHVITDNSFKEIKRAHLLSHGKIDALKQPGTDYHEFILLTDDHYILMAYYEIAPDNIPTHIPHTQGMKLITPVVQEIKNDKVIWQWIGTDYPELYESSYMARDSGTATLPVDYLHANAMFIDEVDGNIILSCRNTSQVLKLNRKKAGIIWKFGGYNSDFAIADTLKPMQQHHVTKRNGNTLLMVDNGNRKRRPWSRIMEYEIDEKTRKVITHTLTPVRNCFIETGGSAQRIGNVYFVGGGTSDFIMEMEVGTGRAISYKSLKCGVYRAIKYTDR